ncbi:MAG: response regulator [Lentimicrobiaceae bacterium]|nr:response regulator [Lentimicrobiaceae bacterium]MCO5265685.1 response regulator [Lentimicrobium sp.]
MNEFNDTDILLVEDNPDDAELTIRALKKNNLANNLVHVWDGEQAFDYLFARNKFAGRNKEILPRLILLDLKLPKIDGLEVLQEIKTNEMTKTVPVVILTSSKEDRDIVESYKFGVNSYIVKPVDFASFITAVKEIGLYWLILNQPPV